MGRHSTWPRIVLELDHLVIAATDLDAGEAWLSARFGVPLVAGGQHVGWGTHNRLLGVGGGAYLELIAADPSQPAPAAPRPFMLDDPALRARLKHAPQLVHWLVRSDDLDTDLAALQYLTGPAKPMTRGALRWRITLPPGGRPPADGLLPTLIQWDVPAAERPGMRLPDSGVRLSGFAVRGPRAVVERRPRVGAAIPIEWVESSDQDEPGSLRATFDTPRGTVTIGGAGR
jgi:hypothetical protein